jgi:hypothetical protein
MNIKREYKLSNLDLFAGYVAYIKEILKKEKTPEENIIEEKDAVYFPDYCGQKINILV